MSNSFKASFFEWLKSQSPRVIVALSSLGMLGWFGHKGTITEVPLTIGICVIAITFLFFNHLAGKDTP